MAHLVFIHGINNQEYYPRDISDNWWRYLEEGWKRQNLPEIKNRPKITVGYYAQRLYTATEGHPYLKNAPNNELPQIDIDSLVSMGEGNLSEFGLGLSLLDEYAGFADIEMPREDIQTMGRLRRNLIKLANALEDRISEDNAKEIARGFLGQAAIYCDAQGLRDGIQRQVMQLISGQNDPMEPIQKLSDDPIILVTHSLGTVVGYRMLFSEAARNTKIPLFITLGSPLSVKFIKSSLDNPMRRFPKPPIDRWINAYHEEDAVTLGNPLSEDEIGFPGIENYGTSQYDADDSKHDIGPHLRTPEICEAIHQLLVSCEE